MSEKKNDALVLADQSTSLQDNSSSTEDSIAQVIVINQDNTVKKSSGRSKWSKKDQRVLSLDHTVHSLAIKCYEDQMPNGWDATQAVIRSTNKKDFQVVAIRHYKEVYAKDDHFWESAFEKNHFHIIFRCVDRNKRMRVGTVLKQLGIVFRPGVDDLLWKEHGVETVGNFGGYTAYLTHETEDAIRDGKELYDHSELVSNLTEEELDEVREGYVRLTDGKRKASAEEMVALDDEAFQRGYDLKDFDDWYHALPQGVRANSKMRLVKESYEYGITKRIEEKPKLVRLFVFIQGERDQGKTGSTLLALSGKKTLYVKSGSTGKFDELKADHDAIVLDDLTCLDPIAMGDNYVCRAYKRNKNNPVWTGKYFIVLSNLEFMAWLKECGETNDERIDAAFSRVFLCRVKERADGTKYLAMMKESKRGTREEQIERAAMFMDFQKKFNEAIANYKPDEELVDYAELKDPSVRTPAEQSRVDEKYALEEQGIIINRIYDRNTEKIWALKRFSEWFWEKDASLWYAYVKNNPHARRNEDAARQFIRTLPNSELSAAVNKTEFREAVNTFALDFIRDAVEWAIAPFIDIKTYDDGSLTEGVD